MNLAAQFPALRRPLEPKIVARVNVGGVKVVKVQGEFVWRQHDETDA